MLICLDLNLPLYCFLVFTPLFLLSCPFWGFQTFSAVYFKLWTMFLNIFILFLFLAWEGLKNTILTSTFYLESTFHHFVCNVGSIPQCRFLHPPFFSYSCLVYLYTLKNLWDNVLTFLFQWKNTFLIFKNSVGKG